MCAETRYTNAAVRLLGFGVDVDEINGYIKGGTFNGAVKLNKYASGEFNSQVFFVSGGKFKFNPSDFLVEGCTSTQEGDYYVGRTEFCSPEVDPEVLIPVRERELTIGEFYSVRITDSEEFDLYATTITY